MFPGNVHDLFFENPQKAGFNSIFARPGGQSVFRIYTIVWNDGLDFEIWEHRNKRVYQKFFPPSVWYKVRDMVRKRFMDAQKLGARTWD